MATRNGKKNGKGQPRWQGEAVEEKPDGEAERAAERAEGNAPIRAEAESRRLHHPSMDGQPQVPKRSDAGDLPKDEDIEAASEEHAARRDAGERSPRGKL